MNKLYRKKPIVIEAEQNTSGGAVYINTLEGKMRANPGDWIITGVKGERYPCKPDIFEETYEAVDEDTNDPVQPTPSAEDVS